MNRKILLLAVLFFSISILYAKDRITSHKIFLGGTLIDNGRVFYIYNESGDTFDAWSMNSDGSGRARITNDALMELAGDVFSDKTKVAVVKKSADIDFVYVMNIDGSNPQNIYSTGLSLDNIRVSPDMKKIAFTASNPLTGNPGTLSVMNIDGSSIKTLSSENVNTSYSISFSSDSEKIAFVDKNDFLSVIDSSGNNLSAITNFAVSNPCFMDDGKIAFVSRQSGYGMATINPDGSSYSLIYSTNLVIPGFAVSPDNTKIVCLVTATPNVSFFRRFSIISSTGTILQEVIANTAYPFIFQGSWVSNSKCMFSDGQNLYTFDVTGSSITNITNNTLPAINMLDDAANSKVIYTNTLADLYSANTDGTGAASLMAIGQNQTVIGLKISPDGTKVLYNFVDTSAANIFKLYIKNSDGSGAPALVEENSSDMYTVFKWSPDGAKIIYQSPVNSTYYTVDSNASNKKAVLPAGDSGSDFTFSPDGTRIAFYGSLAAYSGVNGIYSTDLSTYTLLYNDSNAYNVLDWKGARILIRKFETVSRLYCINQDGKGLKFIDAGESYLASLSPDGNCAAYSITNNALPEAKGFYISNITGDTKVRISTFTYPSYDWSQDSGRIAYILVDRSGNFSKIYSIKADGTGKTLIDITTSLLPSMMERIGSNKIAYGNEFDILTEYIPSSLAPVLSVDPLSLSLSAELGKTRTAALSIANAGDGTLSGTISTSAEWLIATPPVFSGNNTAVNITVDNSILKEKSGDHSGTITITSNGGTIVVNVTLSATCVLASPNPLRSISGEQAVLTFYGDGIVPGQTTIKIFSLSGNLVRTIDNIQAATCNVQLDNLSGGIYVYTYDSPKERGIGKITIIK